MSIGLQTELHNSNFVFTLNFCNRVDIHFQTGRLGHDINILAHKRHSQSKMSIVYSFKLHKLVRVSFIQLLTVQASASTPKA